MGSRTAIMSAHSISSVLAPSVFLALLLLSLATPALSTPIREVQGIIQDVGEGFLLVKPAGDTRPRKFVLKWKARFIPPRLPLKGDHVVIFFKEKDEGAVVYEIKYVKPSSLSLPETPGEKQGVRHE